MAGLSGQYIFSVWGQLQFPARLQKVIIVCLSVILLLSISAICLCPYVSDTISDAKDEVECVTGTPGPKGGGHCARRTNSPTNQALQPVTDAGYFAKVGLTMKVSHEILCGVKCCTDCFDLLNVEQDADVDSLYVHSICGSITPAMSRWNTVLPYKRLAHRFTRFRNLFNDPSLDCDM